MTRAARWSDNDRYWGPFTFSAAGSYKPTGIMLSSGDDDGRVCNLRLSVRGHTMIVALPDMIKPSRQRINLDDDYRRVPPEKATGGYWEISRKEYGFSFVDGALHYHYGRQTHDGSKGGCWFLTWRERRCIRHALIATDGKVFAEIPQGGSRKFNSHKWEAERALKAACPKMRFAFADYDGERLEASVSIEETEYRRGVRWFKWLGWITPKRRYRSINIEFSGETGRRKGSWKGGTIGVHAPCLPGQMHEEAFAEYCLKNGMTGMGVIADAVAGDGATHAHPRHVPDGLANLGGGA